MFPLGLLSCLLFVIVSGNAVPKDDEDLPELKWALKYTFKAEKISLTSGWVEDVQYWRTQNESRVDYNKGAVKILSSVEATKKFPIGVQYEVHPKTTEEKENFMVCTRIIGNESKRASLVNILPDESDFKHVGSAINQGTAVEKFYYSGMDDALEFRNTLWATYDRDTDTWRPLWYENIEYDLWLDFKKTHYIWNYINYNVQFNSSIVFNFENMYDCEDKNPDELYNLHRDSLTPENGYQVDYVFNSFKKKYNKMYTNDEENSLRRDLFEKRMRLVIDNNSKNTGYKLAINKFADRTPEEVKRVMGLIRPRQRVPGTHKFPYTTNEIKTLASNLPKEFDLRDLGIITPVKDQEECGSCWTFGTTSAVEGALARKNGGRLLRLSNQALLDCAWGFGSTGCDGGNDISAYRWIMEYGLPTEEDYGPYANKEGFCHIHNMTKTYPIHGFTNVTPYSVEALKVAIVNHGPLSVSMHATVTFTLYSGGIYYDIACDPNTLNHEVTLVGYGIRDGEEYWIVKNSWGQNWGVDGYFYISVRDNNCGITTEPTYPVL